MKNRTQTLRQQKKGFLEIKMTPQFSKAKIRRKTLFSVCLERISFIACKLYLKRTKAKHIPIVGMKHE